MKKKYQLFLIISIIFLILLLTFTLIFNSDKKENDLNKQETTKIKKVYNIPKVYFQGNIKNMLTKQDIRKIEINYISDNYNFKTYAKIKIQGTSSLAYEKKNYTINLYEDEEYKNKNKIDLGWGPQNKYCLKANWIDKTHSRNIVTAKLASEVSKKYKVLNNTPNNGVIDGYPIEVYINDEFLGIYTWNIPKDGWMLNMDENNNNNLLFSNEDWFEENLFRANATYKTYSIEHGEENKENLEKLNRLINFVKESSNEEFKKNINNYINKDAAINYFIIAEFAGLIDNIAKNMLLATYDGKIWYPILYDLDTSWGTMYDGLSTINYNLNTNLVGSELWLKLETNYKKEIAKRYFELRKDILTKDHVMKMFKEFDALIPKETKEKEQNKWKNIPGYEINQIEEFLDARIPLIDKIMKERLNS